MKKLSAVFMAFILCAAILVSCGTDIKETVSSTSAAGMISDTPLKNTTETSEESASSDTSGAAESSMSDTSDELIKIIYDLNDYKKLGLEDDSGEIRFIRAFLSKDTETLEEICNLEKGTYDALKTLEFGKYSIAKYDNNSSSLIFKFTVLSSGLDTLPPGEYSYYVNQGVDSWEMSPVSTQNPTVLQENLRKWLVISGDYLYREYKTLDKEAQTQFRFNVTYFLLWQYGDMTLAELQQYALELFNVKNFEPHEGAGMLVDGKYTVLGRGGSVWRYDFAGERKENEKTIVTIQFYADASGFIKSHRVEYVMQEKNGKWVFLGSKVIKESTFEPYHAGI